MMIGRVRGTAVSTTKARALNGWKLLIVQPLNIETMEDSGDPVVVMDGVGAGQDEIVMCVGGSYSRQADETKTAPADMTLLGILDSIDIKGRRVYEKYPTEV